MAKRVDILRSLVNKRLTAAAEEIFVLVERTIAVYEEELCRSKEENQRKQKLLDSVLNRHTKEGVQSPIFPEPSVNKEIPGTPQIKEEPEEQRIKQEEEQLPEFTAVCVKSEEQSSLLLHYGGAGADISLPGHLHSKTEEQSSETDNDEDWKPPARSSTAQIKDISTDAHNSGIFSTYMCGAEDGATVTEGHVSETGGGGDKKHECFICHKKFKYKMSLKGHITIHTGEKPHSCPVCNKTFSRKCYLYTHTKTHSGEKPHSCLSCNKTFAHKHKLKEHMRSHTGERPHSCSVCNKKFKTAYYHKVHMRSHTGEKPLSCTICMKTFNYKSNLLKHITIHTKEKP